ncbi:MAG: hypothetical protein NTY36_14495 [Deltaproteobacteria bacterium]|nr:hypothetical protein [Deltaproteobacteria bacterium]
MFIKRKVAQGEILLALALWGVGLAGAASGNPAILQWLYFFAWYPLILFLDGLLFCRRGDSWLLNRPRALLRLAFWSVTVWLVFEAFNYVLKNWGYAGVVANPLVRWPGYALAFATVLPGVLLAAEVLSALGAWRGARSRPRKLPFAWEPAALLLGMASAVLPLVFPRYAFPLIWGAGFFLLDPFVKLLGGRSLIQAWLDGERREHLCLLAAGLFCGLWWEAWNYGATAKWVYTLPVLNFAKVFEMPLLGYLGFPPFALECAVMYNFMQALDERVLITQRRCRYAIVIQLAFWLLMFAALDARTVISFQ